MYNQLTRGQRYAIYSGLQEGKSHKAIARQINVHPPAVGREIKRNPTRSGHYGWRVAQESADIRKERLPGNRRIDGKVLKEVDGKRFGDWEMDLVIGKGQKSALPTLCGRSVNCLPMEGSPTARTRKRPPTWS